MSRVVMARCERTRVPGVGDERTLLTAMLDWNRATLLCKLAGLSDEQLRRTHPPSALSLLVMVKHLTDVEQSWFGSVFAGAPDDEAAGRAAWHLGPEETALAILAAYRDAVVESRRIVANASLDDLARRADGPGMSLRWIVLHMIEETARHLGHADLIREAIDGQTGQ